MRLPVFLRGSHDLDDRFDDSFLDLTAIGEYGLPSDRNEEHRGKPHGSLR
jgi:hypothetical protein